MAYQNVWCVFEKCERSADEDNKDGTIFVWDSEEIGRNLELSELWEWIKKNLDITYDILKEKENKLYEFDLDDLIRELKKESENIFYTYDFQYVSILNYIFDTEEQAKEKINYLNTRTYLKNKWYYSRYEMILK